MSRPLPRYLVRERTRHGAVIFYVRKGRGARIRIRADFGSEAFWKEYQAALGGQVEKPVKAPLRSLAWAIDLYRRSSAWASLSNATRRQRDNIFRSIIKSAGDVPLSAITREKIIEAREKRAARPHAANSLVKALRGLFGWACGDGGLVANNPTTGIKLLEGKNDDGFRTWTDAELERFEAHYPLGTRERVAYAIFGYAGLRRGDAARFGPQHVFGDVIRMVTEKTGDEAVIPVLAELREAIEAGQRAGVVGRTTYIATMSGAPMVKEGLGNWFGDACRKAGCPGSAHGLRKALAVRMAERGATEKQLMAMFGWTSGKMPTHYTRKAERGRLARQAGELWSKKNP